MRPSVFRDPAAGRMSMANTGKSTMSLGTSSGGRKSFLPPAASSGGSRVPSTVGSAGRTSVIHGVSSTYSVGQRDSEPQDLSARRSTSRRVSAAPGTFGPGHMGRKYLEAPGMSGTSIVSGRTSMAQGLSGTSLAGRKSMAPATSARPSMAPGMSGTSLVSGRTSMAQGFSGTSLVGRKSMAQGLRRPTSVRNQVGRASAGHGLLTPNYRGWGGEGTDPSSADRRRTTVLGKKQGGLASRPSIAKWRKSLMEPTDNATRASSLINTTNLPAANRLVSEQNTLDSGTSGGADGGLKSRGSMSPPKSATAGDQGQSASQAPPPPPANDRPYFHFYHSNFDSDDVFGKLTAIEVGFRPGAVGTAAAWGAAANSQQVRTSGDILAVGGIKDTDHTDGICMAMRYVKSQRTWEEFTDLPERRFSFAVGFLNDCLYVIGGYDPKTKTDGGSGATKSTFRFDLREKRWESASDMQSPRSFHTVCCLGNRLYALGGQDEWDRVLSSVEVYDPSADSWSLRVPMSVPRVGACCVSVMGRILVAGGYGEPASGGAPSPVLLSTEWFDPNSNRWEMKADLRVARAQACLVQVYDALYLCGGISRDPLAGALCSIRDVDKYCSFSEEWEHVTDLPVARHNAGAVFIDGKIYIVGGVSTATNQTLRSVDSYDINSRSWENSVPCLPRGAKSIFCFVIPEDV